MSALKAVFFRPETTEDRNRFALESGERQTGKTLAEVRYDHVARYQYVAETVERTFPQPERLFGLDAFCATGYGTSLVADRLHCALLGIDASNDAIGFANNHYSGPRTFFCCKLFPFELPPETFDFAVCLESIEHISGTNSFLEQVVASLKPGGLLILSTPNAGRWSLEKNPNPFHYRHFTRQEVMSMVGASGCLEVVEWHGQDLYRFEEDRLVATLPGEKMGLTPSYDGQVLIFALRKAR